MTDGPHHPLPDAADRALLRLLALLARRGYDFVTPTPATQARVVKRADRQAAHSVEDVLGWSLPFGPGSCDAEVGALLAQAGVIDGGRATIRVSRLGGRLFLHSAYPTTDDAAVFFGPDSYRFATLLGDELRDRPVAAGALVADIGTGSGVGGIVAASACPGIALHLTDVNPAALRFARLNAAAAQVPATLHQTATLEPIGGAIDLAIANPPYIVDGGGRMYRDGGAMHGGQVSLDMAVMAMRRLAPGGRLILYTGSAIVRGEDRLKAALGTAAADHGCTIRYREIDPDVFGEELDEPAYRDVDRIAVIAAVMTRDATGAKA